MSKENEYPDDIIDGRGADDGLLSHAIAQANLFSEETLRVFPLSHPDLPQDEIDRMRTLIKSCSFIGFRRGYLQGHADGNKSEGQIKVAGSIPGKDDKVVSKPEMVKLRRQRKQKGNG